MSKANGDASTQEARYRQRLNRHLDKLALHRTLIADMEHEGKDVRPVREKLRDLLTELDTILSEYQKIAGAEGNTEA
jgi:hypothetical protein